SGSRRALCLPVYLFMFHLHLAMDLAGSGPGWGIHYFWPMSDANYEVSWTWPLYSWQNILAFFILLGWTLLIAIRKLRTALELVTPSRDRQLVDFTSRRRAAESLSNTDCTADEQSDSKEPA